MSIMSYAYILYKYMYIPFQWKFKERNEVIHFKILAVKDLNFELQKYTQFPYITDVCTQAIDV